MKLLIKNKSSFTVNYDLKGLMLLLILGYKLKVISTMSAGYEHLDLAEIKRRGIKVGHTPVVLSAAVAEIAILLLLNAARRAHEGRSLLEA